MSLPPLLAAIAVLFMIAATVLGTRDNYALAEYRAISTRRAAELDASLQRERELSANAVALKDHLSKLMAAYIKATTSAAPPLTTVAGTTCADPYTEMEILLRKRRAD